MGAGLARSAAEALFEHDSIEADVFDAAYLRPFDEAALLESAEKTGRRAHHRGAQRRRRARRHRRRDHRPGRAVRQLDQVALPDQDLEVGVPAELYEFYGLTTADVAKQGPQPGQEVTIRAEPLLDPTGEGNQGTNTSLAMPRPQSLAGG